MINLFSTFDPSTSHHLSLNWMITIFLFIFLPMPYWFHNSQHSQPFNLFSNNLLKELLSMNMFNPKGILLIYISIFYFILTSNYFGLLPYTFTLTSHISVTLPLAFSLWICIMMFWSIKHSNHMLTHILPFGTPTPLMFFMVCIETISTLIRPLTLSVRLTANMIAGHLLISLLSNTMCKMSLINNSMFFFSLLLLFSLEFAVATIQSYVFMTLISLYSAETMS